MISFVQPTVFNCFTKNIDPAPVLLILGLYLRFIIAYETGASNFIALAIASLVLPYFGVKGVVHVYALLYIIAFILTFLLKVKQPGFENRKIH